MSSTTHRRTWAVLAAVAAGGLLALAWLGRSELAAAARSDPRIAAVRRGTFEDVIRRFGALEPVVKDEIKALVRGNIVQIVEDGKRVETGELLFLCDQKPHRESLAKHEASMRRMKAEREKDRQRDLKELRKAQDDVESRRLRLDLEKLRLKDLEAGPGASDELNARIKLENAKNLHQARAEELTILEELAADGYVSQTEVRQKRLDVREQALKVEEAQLAYRRLHTPDPVKLAEQKLKVRDEDKNLAAAAKRMDLLDQNIKQAEAQFNVRWKREESRRKELAEDIDECLHVAPHPGVALIGTRWGMKYGPGREVSERSDVITLSDLRRMKALLTVDEGRIGRVGRGQVAIVRPSGGGASWEGKVVRVAEKGRDEFENYLQQTRDIVGRADRQVFEVEVEVDAESALLRPGLQVTVEITLDRMENVLILPRAALTREKGGKAYVRLDTPLGPERKDVKVLAENELECVVEGLEEGRRVWLVEP